MPKVFKPASAIGKQADTKIQRPEFLTGILQQGQRIITGATFNGPATATLYIVPAGKKFFLSSVVFDAENLSGVTTTNASLIIGGTDELIFLNMPPAAKKLVTLDPNFTISLDSNETIEALSPIVQQNISVRLCGYEIDAALIPNFI